MNLMQVSAVEIGGRTFQIRLLPFIEARKAYSRLQRLLAVHGDDAVAKSGLGLFMFAGLAGLVSDEDLAFFCDVYGKATDVVLSTTQTITLSSDSARTTVFSGAFEDLFTWLDAATKLNFEAVMGKLDAARRQLKANAAETKSNQAE